MRFIAGNADRPFFLNLWNYGVHGPWGHKPEYTKAFMGKKAGAKLKVTLLEPSERLGSLRDALVWNASNIERWMDLGRRDASSITM